MSVAQDFIAVFPDQIASKTPVKYDDKFTKILKATELKFAEKQTRSGPRVRAALAMIQRFLCRFAVTHLSALLLAECAQLKAFNASKKSKGTATSGASKSASSRSKTTEVRLLGTSACL